MEVIAEAEPKVLEEHEEAAIPDPNPSSSQQQHCPPNRRPFRVLLTSECAYTPFSSAFPLPPFPAPFSVHPVDMPTAPTGVLEDRQP